MTERAGLLPGDDVLSIRNGQLFIEDVAVSALAQEYDTPLYVIAEAQLRANVRAWHASVQSAWRHGSAMVLPSLKANTSPALRAILNDEGAGCDVFGEGELEIALRVGVTPSSISLNGATKSERLLRRGIAAGVRITLDSADEFERARRVANELGQTAYIRFRLRPWLPSTSAISDFDPDGGPAYVAVQDYRAGMPMQDIPRCLDAAIDDPFLDPVGVHAHASRQTTDLAFWHAYAQEVGVRCAELAEAAGWHPTEIDLGGGFAVPRDPTGRIPLPEGTLAPSPREYMHALATGLEAGLDQGGLSPQGIGLQVEPGRAIYGNAGIHLTRVLNVKHQDDPEPRTWIETDTSETFLGDTIIERNAWTVVLADDPQRAERYFAAVTGRSCGFDLLIPPLEQPKVAAGELLAFLDTGAYQDVTANNFNVMPRPASVLVTSGTHRLIRRRETLDDILERDVWPNPRDQNQRSRNERSIG